MDEFYNFLAENWIDKNKFKVNKLPLDDILVLDKKISQKVVQEWKQKREEEWEWLEKNKKEIPYNFQFDKNKAKLWKSIVYWIQPGTYGFDDCKTCDWHWEISCSKCSWTWELKCWHCKWKWIIVEDVYTKQKVENICSVCNGTTQITWKCNFCLWKWIITKKQKCISCKWFWKIKNPQTNQFQLCQACQWKWWIVTNIKCNNCNGWIITKKCNNCINWKVSKIVTNSHKENKDCNYCNKTGNVICNSCNWNRNITCKTCSWERKTYQYQFNTFTIDVTKNYKLLNNNKFNSFENLISIFYKIPYSKVKTLTVQEKEKLLLEKITIKENNISSIKWNIFKFQEKETLIDYFIFYDNLSKRFYYSKLPPKSKMDAQIDFYLNKIKNVYDNIYNKYLYKIIKLFKNKKDY